MKLRVEQWGQIWHRHAREEPLQVSCLPDLIKKGQAYANDMQPLRKEHIWRTIKQLALKAPEGLMGLDLISFGLRLSQR